ncbi:MFS transporter [Pelomonas sp. KK5]|uniref:MFS transporter n=1 Tax=Pelomonas sp. KK5 TaxID=1855730 RepID=UPI00097BB780|nr:MFS transporter [Pelomonas sp. KK5]
MHEAHEDDAQAARRIAWIVGAAFFMETLDSMIIATALPAMARSFGTTPLQMSQGITAYLVAMAAFAPAAGWSAERFGARRMFVGAIAAFTGASVLCGLAPSPATFFAARALQGAAAALMSPVGRFVVLRETPKQRLIEAIGTITWPGLIGPVVGPVLGGLIVEHASWRWAFFLNLPLGMIGAWLVMRFFPLRKPGHPQALDLRGFLLNATALGAIVQGLSLLGERQGEGIAVPLSVLAFGLAAGALALRHAARAQAPMLDLRVLRVRSFRMANATAGFLSRVAIHASPFLLPLMLQVGMGMSPLDAGTAMLVYMAGNLLMKAVTTPVLRRYGFRTVLTVNGAICALTLVACGTLVPDTPTTLLYGCLLAAGLSRSLNFTAIATLAFADVPDEQRANATGLSTMLQQLAISMGVAFAALALGLSQSMRDAGSLQMADFRHAWFAAGALMALAALVARRLDHDAGAAIYALRSGGRCPPPAR